MHTSHLAAPNLNAPTLLQPRGQVLDETYATSLIPAPRPADSHKENYGSVGVLGGADGMVGAVFLAAGATYLKPRWHHTSPQCGGVSQLEPRSASFRYPLPLQRV